ncbi:hypothetical protein P5673_029829 [Acropora cervicornis]|uniref:Uncharacterized protein n=1 Tax=Acropora cervicornis TaxID=6130 RepID=A0AAD9PV78_ACRCE|nr:hypothetical protein P5673_029829 [Acropora cervicornis]
MENSALTFLPGTFFQIETKEVQKLKTESLPAEWSQKKYHETDNIKMIPTEVKSDSMVVSWPVNHAWPKMGPRSRFQNDMLQAMLAVGVRDSV